MNDACPPSRHSWRQRLSSGSMNPGLLDRGIGFPLADRTRPAGYGFFQALRVLFEPVFLFENLTQEIKQQLSVRFPGSRDAIKDTIAVAAVEDYPRVLQVGKVPRYIRLRIFEDILDVTDAEFAMQQKVDDSEPVRVRKRFEYLFYVHHGSNLSLFIVKGGILNTDIRIQAWTLGHINFMRFRLGGGIHPIFTVDSLVCLCVHTHKHINV